MGFLVPAFLAGAVAAAVPIVLHLLRRETAPPLPFSAVRFLVRAPEERSAHRRLREWWLLVLRVAALVGLAVAFARPYSAGAAGGRGVTIVAVDTSFSVAAPDRFARVRRAARAAIDQADPGHLVGVLSFADRAALVAEPTADRAAARAAIDRLEAGYGATRYRAALERAAAAIGEFPGRVTVVTDLQRAGWSPDDVATVPADVEVRVADVGAVTGNLAVTGLAVEDGRPVATIRAAGETPPRTRLRFFVDDRPIGDRLVEVGLDRTTRVAVEADLPQAGVLRAVVEDPGGYAADDVRYLVLDARRVPVLLVTATGSPDAEALYATRALAAADPRRAFDVTVVSSQALAAEPERLATSAAVVLMSTRALGRRTTDAILAHVRSGRGGLILTGGDAVSPVAASSLVTAVGGDASGARVTLRRAPGTMVVVDARHPIAQELGPLGARLGRVAVERALALDGPAWRVVARFTDGTVALAERSLGLGRVIWFASDLTGAWNDLPRDPAFVPFLHETIRHAAGAGDEPASYLVGQTPRDVPDRPGVVTVGTPPRRVAVNVDGRESDPARLTVEELLRAVRRSESSTRAGAPEVARQAEAAQGYWRYLLAFVFVTFLVEGWMGRR